jgi:hypothetical protein
MPLETCNASVLHYNIGGAAQSFADLTLDTYPGKNISDLCNEALRVAGYQYCNLSSFVRYSQSCGGAERRKQLMT